MVIGIGAAYVGWDFLIFPGGMIAGSAIGQVFGYRFRYQTMRLAMLHAYKERVRSGILRQIRKGEIKVITQADLEAMFGDTK